MSFHDSPLDFSAFLKPPEFEGFAIDVCGLYESRFLALTPNGLPMTSLLLVQFGVDTGGVSLDGLPEQRRNDPGGGGGSITVIDQKSDAFGILASAYAQNCGWAIKTVHSLKIVGMFPENSDP